MKSIARRSLSALVLVAALWPSLAEAQKSPPPLIGLLGSGAAETNAHVVVALAQGLRTAGYVVGDDIAIEQHWADGDYERLKALALTLSRRDVAVIAAVGLPAALAAKSVASTKPVVFFIGTDPVSFGLVDSLARPGANVTGITATFGSLGAKRLELMRELVGRQGEIAILINAENPNSAGHLRQLEAAAGALGQAIHVLSVKQRQDLDLAFATVKARRCTALLVADDPLFNSWRSDLVARAAQAELPAIYYSRDFPTVGGLISYGPNIADHLRWTGVYAGQILRGARPADLPVLEPATFELVINLKAARGLSLDIPAAVIARADEIID